MLMFLFFSCASDIKISPRDYTAVLYGLELSPSSYEPIEIPIQTEHQFDFLLIAHQKTTIQNISFLSGENEEVWSIDMLVEPPLTLSENSEMKLTISITPNQIALFEQELQIKSSRDDWTISLQVDGISP